MSQNLQQSGLEGPQRTVTQHINGFRQLLLQLDTSGRQALNAFWKDVRQSLNDQDSTVTTLLQQIEGLQQRSVSVPATPQRPPTSHSVNVIRDTVQQAIQNEAQYAQDASTTIEEICDVDPAWAMGFVVRQKDAIACTNSELGCWLSGNAAAHENGYVKMNMRGTRVPGHPTDRFSVQPFGHQMGVVASGHGPELRLTTKGQFHVCALLSNSKWSSRF
jgi:hypothetical protein